MHSILVNIHNAARKISTGEILLEKVLDAIVKHTTGDYELICMVDGCTDESENIVDKYANAQKIILPNVFEVKSNNAGLKQSKGDYAIIVQDDQVVCETGWNKRLQKPYDEFTDVFAVTARVAHNFIRNPNSRDIHNPDGPQNNWCDYLTTCDGVGLKHGNLPRNTFAIRSTVCRGPLMLDMEDLRKLDYLDESFAPCDMDDHDLMFRAHKQLNKVCGAYSINMEADHAWSAIHGSGTPQWLYKAHHKNTKIFFERHKDILDSRRIIENRVLK